MNKNPLKTLDIIKHKENQLETVVLPQEVCTMTFKQGNGLSLGASKLFVQLIKYAGKDVVEDKSHKIPMAKIDWSKKSKEHLRDYFRELQQTLVMVTTETQEHEAGILGDVARDHDFYGGEAFYEFSKVFRMVFAKSQLWATISATAVLMMDSKYSVWLYQLLATRENLNNIVGLEVGLEDLRERLGATAKTYHVWRDLRRAVIEPAIKEINFLTNILVSFEPVKHGRNIVAVRFFVAKKTMREQIETQKEHEKSKSGRKERMKAHDDLLSFGYKATLANDKKRLL